MLPEAFAFDADRVTRLTRDARMSNVRGVDGAAVGKVRGTRTLRSIQVVLNWFEEMKTAGR